MLLNENITIYIDNHIYLHLKNTTFISFLRKMSHRHSVWYQYKTHGHSYIPTNCHKSPQKYFNKTFKLFERQRTIYVRINGERINVTL